MILDTYLNNVIIKVMGKLHFLHDKLTSAQSRSLVILNQKPEKNGINKYFLCLHFKQNYF